MTKKKGKKFDARSYSTSSIPKKVNQDGDDLGNRNAGRPTTSFTRKSNLLPNSDGNDIDSKEIITAGLDSKNKSLNVDSGNSSLLTADKVHRIKVENEHRKELERRKLFYNDSKLHSLKLDHELEFKIIKYLQNAFPEDTHYFLEKEKHLATDVNRLNVIYLNLQRLEFEKEVIEKALSRSLLQDFNNIMNWICLYVPATELPKWMYDRVSADELIMHEADKRVSVSEMKKEEGKKLVKNDQVDRKKKKKKKVENSNMKSWILQKYSYLSDDEVDENREKDLQDQGAAKTPTNVHYAQVKVELEQLKQEAQKAKEEGNENLKIELTKNLRECKQKLQDISTNRDYNPKLANEQFRILMQEAANCPRKQKKESGKSNDDDDSEFLHDLFSDDRIKEQYSNSPLNTSKKNGKDPIIMKLSYTREQWTGKSPKQYCMDWISKNAKGTKATFYQINGNENSGFRYGARLSGGKKEFDGKKVEMDNSELAGTVKEAEHYSATKLLYLLLPNLPLHRSLPPPYRDVWLNFVSSETKNKVDQEEDLLQSKITFLESIAQKRTVLVNDLLKRNYQGITSDEFAFKENGDSNEFNNMSKNIQLLNMNGQSSVLKISREMKRDFENRMKSKYYQEFQNQRKELPVFEHKDYILKVIEHHQITIVSGETGSGKSTQVPQFMLQNALISRDIEYCNIICTQPRRISAISISSRVSEEIGDKPESVGAKGSLVGYQIRLESKVSETTRLTFCTTGVLLRRIEQDPFLKDVTHVVIDEVHERSIESDFLLLLLKEIARKRSELKIILMSATADAGTFLNYFMDFDCAPLIQIPGRTFPVQQFFLEDAIETTNYIIENFSEFSLRRKDGHSGNREETGPMRMKGRGGKTYDIKLSWTEDDIYDQMEDNRYWELDEIKYSLNTRVTISKLDVHKINYDLIERLIENICLDPRSKNGAILVFLPGIGEIKRLYDGLLMASKTWSFSATSDIYKFLILPLHSVLDSRDQSRVFKPPPKNTRKIVLATNIAETGITIPDVVYVVDTCRAKQVYFDDRKHVTRLNEVFIAQANCQQRRGRAGRVQEGVCFHLIPKEMYCSLATYQSPEIVRLPLEELCLRAKSYGINSSLMEFLSLAISPPPVKNVERSIGLLKEIGALNENEELTALGKKLSSLPVDVKLGKLLIYGALFRCLNPTCIIAAMLSLNKSPFSRPFGQEAQADSAKRQFFRLDSDLLTMLNAYRTWESMKIKYDREKNTESYKSTIKKFCATKFLSLPNLEQIEETSLKFTKIIKSQRFLFKSMPDEKLNKFQNDDCVILLALSCGLYPNIVSIDPSCLSITETIPTQSAIHEKSATQFKLLTSTETVQVHSSSVLKEGPVAGGGTVITKEQQLQNLTWAPSQYFSFYAMSRSGTGNKNLVLWDVNRIPLVSFLLCCLDLSLVIEHRCKTISLVSSRHMIKCFPRSASLIQIFGEKFQQGFIKPFIYNDRQETIQEEFEKDLNLLIDILKSEM